MTVIYPEARDWREAMKFVREMGLSIYNYRGEGGKHWVIEDYNPPGGYGSCPPVVATGKTAVEAYEQLVEIDRS